MPRTGETACATHISNVFAVVAAPGINGSYCWTGGSSDRV